MLSPNIAGQKPMYIILVFIVTLLWIKNSLYLPKGYQITPKIFASTIKTQNLISHPYLSWSDELKRKYHSALIHNSSVHPFYITYFLLFMS